MQAIRFNVIMNYDESVVVYGSGFVCHDEEVFSSCLCPDDDDDGNKYDIQGKNEAPCGSSTL